MDGLGGPTQGRHIPGEVTLKILHTAGRSTFKFKATC